MKCRTCDYRLWHLTAQVCPECGTAFRPSDYEFVPHTVEFCCPHCEQPYFGTDAQGLLDPRAFDCVSCGRHIHMDQMLLRPAPGVDERTTQVERAHWLERREIGIFRAWLGTTRMALFSPGRLMRLVPMDASLQDGHWFSVLTFFISHVFMWIALLAWMGFIIVTMAGGHGGGGMPFIGITFCGMALIAPLIAIVCMILWASVAHGILRLTGRTRGTWNRTMQAFCYSSGSYVVAIVPCCGFYVAPIWWLVSAILAVREGQKVNGGRATLAVASLPVVAVLSLIGLQIVLTHAAATYVPSTASRIAFAHKDTDTVLQGLLRFKDVNQGQWPTHALALAAECYVPEEDFIGGFSLATLDAVPVAGTTLRQFASRSITKRTELAEKAGKDLPADVVAHRLGDFVFVYHGLDPDTADPNLWVVVFAPEVPAAPADPADPGDPVLMVGLFDGSVLIVRDDAGAFPSLAQQLEVQNRLRAQAGLPPLPDPRTVTHTQPAVAPASDP